MNQQPISQPIVGILQEIKNLVSKQKPVVISLDGRSGVGKSTIAGELAENLDSVILHCDDFYAGPPDGNENNWHTKTPREKIDQVFDWERLRSVLQRLIAGKNAQYQPFNFETGVGLSSKIIHLNPAPVIILDGIYSTEKLGDLVDITLLIKFSDEQRRERLVAREGAEFMQEWHQIWDSAEDYYFSKVQLPESFDFRMKGEV